MATSSNFVISSDHLDELKYAKALLENPSLAAKMTDYLGTPIELFMDKLPSNWNQKLSGVTHSALNKAADAALYTMKDFPGEASSNYTKSCSSGYTCNWCYWRCRNKYAFYRPFSGYGKRSLYCA